MADGPSFEEWQEAMRAGDFTRAWTLGDRYLDSLPKCIPVNGECAPLWRNEPLAGKRVLIRCRHGLGDTIQFIRFASALRKIARDVTVLAQPQLVTLVSTAPGVDRALPLTSSVKRSRYDSEIEIMELAYALRADVAAVRCTSPYLLRPPHVKVRPAARPWNIGVVWRAGEWRSSRSVPPKLLSPLGKLPYLRLISLQCGPAASEARCIPAFDASSRNVEHTVAVLRRLDLLISVDTFAAHLAGALGVPVWLLLQRDCDWRWMYAGDDCVWYPTMRLFRQRRQGDWNPVVEAVIAQLKDYR